MRDVIYQSVVINVNKILLAILVEFMQPTESINAMITSLR